MQQDSLPPGFPNPTPMRQWHALIDEQLGGLDLVGLEGRVQWRSPEGIRPIQPSAILQQVLHDWQAPSLAKEPQKLWIRSVSETKPRWLTPMLHFEAGSRALSGVFANMYGLVSAH